MGPAKGYVAVVRRMLVALTALLVVAVVADYGSRVVAQDVIAQRVRQATAMQATPAVQVSGFPFLTQVIAGTYHDVTVSAVDLPATRGLQVSQVRGSFVGVHVPLSDLVHGGNGPIPVDRVQVSGTVGFAALEAAVTGLLPEAVVALKLSDAGGDQLRIRADYRVAGVSASVAATAKVTLSGGTLRLAVAPQSVTGVPAALAGQVAAALGIGVDLQQFPLGLRPTAVSVGAGGVSVTAVATNVLLPASG